MTNAAAEVQVEPETSEVPNINKANRRMLDLDDPLKAFQVITQSGDPKYIKKLSKFLAAFAAAMEDED